MSIDHSISRIRAFMRAEGLTPSGLARRAGLHKNSLRGLLDEGWSPRAETIRRIERIIPPEFSSAAEGLPAPEIAHA